MERNYLFLISISAIILIFPANAAEVSTNIPPNPINVFNKQLQEKEAELFKKETEINTRQAFSQKQIFIGGGIIFALVFLNFYLDYQHRKNNKE